MIRMKFNLLVLGVALILGEGMPRPVSASVLNDIGSGQLLIEGQGALMLDTSAHIDANGMIAHVSLEQTFQNPSQSHVEGLYVFPLLENASVFFMEMRIGERRITADIREKGEAKRIYTAARAAGKKAALVEQQRPNMFKQSVANISPGEQVTIALKFYMPVQYDRGEFSIRLPMTITERFYPGGSPAEGQLMHTAAGPAPALTSTMLHATITADVTPGFDLKQIVAAYHDLSISKHRHSYSVSLKQTTTPMDRDFVMTWSPVRSAKPQAAVFKETLDGEDYVMFMMLPPNEVSGLVAMPREMIFIIDTSGSMQGQSIIQAKHALLAAIDSLRPEDSFNVIEFNNHATSVFMAPQPADHYSKDVAAKWVRSLSADGGTNMLTALNMAFQMPRDEALLRHVIFVTDGAVGNETQLFASIHSGLADGRLFTVGIGSAPNSFFMRKAAEFGRGTFTYIGDAGEARDEMLNLFEKIDSPMASNIQVQWPGTAEVYPERVPDLYLEEPLIVVARGHNLMGDLYVTGNSAFNAWAETLSLNTGSSSIGVGALWGRAKIGALEDSQVTGRNPDEVKSEIIQVALAHHLVSRFTSLVAVEQVVERLPGDQLAKVKINNPTPQGQRTAQYPATATNARLNMLLGIICLMLLVLYRVRWSRAAEV